MWAIEIGIEKDAKVNGAHGLASTIISLVEN
jgi:hypothetical protein